MSAHAWAVVLSPGLVLLVEREVRREEQRLDEQFGFDYSAYRRRVPRYLPLPHRRSVVPHVKMPAKPDRCLS